MKNFRNVEFAMPVGHARGAVSVGSTALEFQREAQSLQHRDHD